MALFEAKRAVEIALVAVVRAQSSGAQVNLSTLRQQRERLAKAILKEGQASKESLVREAQRALDAADELLTGGKLTSPTLAILGEEFFSPKFEELGPSAKGVHARFMRPTPPVDPTETRLRRVISEQQAEAYKRMRDSIIAQELIYGRDHYVFYHAQDPRMRVAQDIYARAYMKYHECVVPDDFHFFRFPAPGDGTFSQWDDANEFLIDKIKESGMIDDNDAGTKLHIISANLSLFGSLGHAGEETFHYFQIGKGQTPLDPTWFVGQFLSSFGYDPSMAGLLVGLGDLIDTTEGSMFQIFVPKEHVDEVAWMAHPHGIPHDDELLDDVHYIGDVRYNWVEVEGVGRVPKREKMNDELTRKLKLFPQRDEEIEEIVVDPPPLRSAMKGGRKKPPRVLSEEEIQLREDATSRRFRTQLDELTARTIERAKAGRYKPSQFLDAYAKDPSAFRHEHFEKTAKHQSRAPDHVGHGLKSAHEIERIRNRPLFMQARVLLANNLMLNPNSGVRVVRHTTVSDEAMDNYHRLLTNACDLLLRPKRPLALTYPGFGM